MTRTPSALLLAILLTGPLSAQDTPPDTTDYVLPGITVSAARTNAALVDLPMAVTVVGKAELEARNGFRLDEAFEAVPGVLAQSRYGSTDIRVVIRGFGARGAGDRSNAGTTRGVRILQDGVPETEPDGRTSFDLVDLAAVESVEVIRSNASSLWGNAAGGLINFVSTPAFDRPFVAVRQEAAGFGLTREIAQLGAALGAGKLSASVIRTDFDGWRQNSEGSRSLLNLAIASPLGDATDLRVHVLAANNRFEIPGPLTRAALDADPAQANATYLARRERRWNRLGRVATSLEHRAGTGQTLSGMVFVNPKYLQRSERNTYRDFTRYHFGGNVLFRDERSLGARHESRLTLGADEAYQDGAILFYNLVNAERGTTVAQNKREGANNLGFFAQEELSLGRRLDLTVGVRYDDVTYYSDDFLAPSQNAQMAFTGWTPKLGLLYRVSEHHSVYANLGGGVEVPAGNETDPVTLPGASAVTTLNALLDPIRSTTVEVGTRQLRTFPGALQALSYDAALYLTEVRNEIVPYRGGVFYFTAAKAMRKGAELGLEAALRGGLSVGGTLTLSDNRYDDYRVDSVYYGRPGPIADYSDNHVVGVPGVFGSGRVGWTPPALDVIELGLGLQHVGDYFADDANRLSVPGYTVYNAALELLPITLGALDVRATLRVDNLTDERYVASAFLNPDVIGGVPVAFEPGLPRHVFVSVALGWRR
jgi:iron complex outermembrane receptor protein